MTREERREYLRKWRDEHKEYRKMVREEHREKLNAKNRKWRAEHSDVRNARMRNRRAEYKEEYSARRKIKTAEDLNKNGVTKNYIRLVSRRILEKCLSKIQGYEIHHCFGYEDAEKFIYIPRDLHLNIHQFLRDNNIPAHIDHFNAIRELISCYPGYTYIHS